MAHYAMIDGSAKEITGGGVLVDGTGYDIIKGRTLVGGTANDITFTPATVPVALYLDANGYNPTLDSNIPLWSIGFGSGTQPYHKSTSGQITTYLADVPYGDLVRFFCGFDVVSLNNFIGVPPYNSSFWVVPSVYFNNSLVVEGSYWNGTFWDDETIYNFYATGPITVHITILAEIYGYNTIRYTVANITM